MFQNHFAYHPSSLPNTAEPRSDSRAFTEPHEVTSRAVSLCETPPRHYTWRRLLLSGPPWRLYIVENVHGTEVARAAKAHVARRICFRLNVERERKQS